MPSLGQGPPDQRRLARWLSTTVLGVLFAILVLGGLIGGLIEANVAKWAERQGHDMYLVQWWDAIAGAFVSLSSSRLFWAATGFFAGTTAMLWLVRKQPNLDGLLLGTPRQINALWRFFISPWRPQRDGKRPTSLGDQPGMTIWQALNYLATKSQWSYEPRHQMEPHALLDEALRACSITAWGQRCLTPPSELEDALAKEPPAVQLSGHEECIPCGHWAHMTIIPRWIGYAEFAHNEYPTALVPHISGRRGNIWVHCYGHLRVNSAEIKRAWPPRSLANPAGSPTLPKWPNFQAWDERNVLHLYEAACLWNEEEPSLPMSEAAQRTYWEFHRAIYERRLGTKANLDESLNLAMAQTGWPLAPNEDDPVNVKTKVSRSHLRSFAEAAGVRPKFLFPDQRAGRRPT